jgi:hypothetical protein
MNDVNLLLQKAGQARPPAMPDAATDWPRLLALLEMALELHDPQQAAWVASLDLCASSKLHLRRLLERHRAIQAGGFQEARPNTRCSR